MLPLKVRKIVRGRKKLPVGRVKKLDWKSCTSRLLGHSGRSMGIRMMHSSWHSRECILFHSSDLAFVHVDEYHYDCSEQETVFSALVNPPTVPTIAALTSTIARRLTPQPIKLRADIELTCYTPAGIDAIKKALRAGESESNETVPIKAKLVAPPLYVLSTNATDKVRNRC